MKMPTIWLTELPKENVAAIKYYLFCLMRQKWNFPRRAESPFAFSDASRGRLGEMGRAESDILIL